MAKAFPGAYGWGAQSVGGRGGTVIEVTNTNNSGAGSFRAAVDKTYPRIIVFRTGGIITLTNDLYINDPFLTIAGQTAPGGGITIKGRKLILSTNNIIIRYLRWRGGANSFISMRAENDCHDVIIDHSSMSWGEDDTVDIWVGTGAIQDIYNVTIQNCLIAEPDPSHPTGFMCGAELESDPTVEHIPNLHHISIHHNLFVHNDHRNPRVSAEHSEVINNVVYNWGARLGGTARASEADWINNYFLDGPMTGSVILKHVTYSGETIYDDASLYINGNIAPNMGYPTEDIDNWEMYIDYFDETPISLDHRRYSPLGPAPFPVPIQSAADAFASVLADVGANARLNFEGVWVANIDETDTRLLADVAAETGPSAYGDITVPGTIGDIVTGTAYTDTDSDGMPDDWEDLRGLDPSDDTDGPEDLGNGYSNVEVFLNGKDSAHIYIGVENLNLSGEQKQTLIDELEALGPASNPQPARLNHWRVNGEVTIFEALFDEDNLTIEKFKERLGGILSVDPGTITHVISQADYAGSGSSVVVLTHSATDYLRLFMFGYVGAVWAESGDECRGYL